MQKHKGADVVTVQDNMVYPLYKHIFPPSHPTVAFIGLPAKIIPFPQVAAQCHALYFKETVSCPHHNTQDHSSRPQPPSYTQTNAQTNTQYCKEAVVYPLHQYTRSPSHPSRHKRTHTRTGAMCSCTQPRILRSPAPFHMRVHYAML